MGDAVRKVQESSVASDVAEGYGGLDRATSAADVYGADRQDGAIDGYNTRPHRAAVISGAASAAGDERAGEEYCKFLAHADKR
jgi:hypothetical protein